MAGLTTQIIQKPNPLTIIQRVVERDETAVKDCIDTYGNFVWALARKFTASTEEAEVAARKIFIDIWQHCARADKIQFVEEKLIAMIALRRLINSAKKSNTNL